MLKVWSHSSTSSSWIGCAFTTAALLISISIWNEGVAVGFVKTAFAALTMVAGAEGSRRSARTGSAVILYVVER